MSTSDRQQRARERRARMSLRRTTVSDEGPDPQPLTGAAAVALVPVLTAEAWRLSGQSMPTYTRDELPVRFVPGGRG